MFSEEKAVLKGTEKPSDTGGKKGLNFDMLEEKINEKMDKMALEKKPKKYSADKLDSPLLQKKPSLKKEQKSSTQSLNLKPSKKDNKEVARSSSMEKVPDPVGMGLFEAATVMCNIVDISQDSTMKGVRAGSSGPGDKKFVRQRTQTEFEKKSSTSSQSGPFSSIKESAQKKKRSFDDEDTVQ